MIGRPRSTRYTASLTSSAYRCICLWRWTRSARCARRRRRENIPRPHQCAEYLERTRKAADLAQGRDHRRRQSCSVPRAHASVAETSTRLRTDDNGYRMRYTELLFQARGEPHGRPTKEQAWFGRVDKSSVVTLQDSPRRRRLAKLQAAQGLWKNRTDIPKDGVDHQQQLRAECR